MSRVVELENENSNLKSCIETQDKKIADLEKRIEGTENYKTQIDRIETQQERSDRILRKDQLIIKGSSVPLEPPEGQNIKEATVQFLANTLNMQKEDLKRSGYTLFGKNKNCILMTTTRKEDQIALFQAVRTIKPSNLSICEFLSPKKAKLLYVLRKMKYEKKNIRSLFTLSGRIYQRLKILTEIGMFMFFVRHHTTSWF